MREMSIETAIPANSKKILFLVSHEKGFLCEELALLCIFIKECWFQMVIFHEYLIERAQVWVLNVEDDDNALNPFC